VKEPRSAFVSIALILAACVPASDPAPPAGALGFAVEPSAATRGEPVVTSDGWTMRFERVAFQMSVSAMSTSPDKSSHTSYGQSGTFRFDASQSVQIFSRAIAVGPATAQLAFQGTYIGNGDFKPSREDETENIGLSDEDKARFFVRSDVSASSGYVSYNGPSMLLVVRAERPGRAVGLDLTFDLPAGYAPSSQRMHDVVADALVTIPITAQVEALFQDDNTHEAHFEDFAVADINGDGMVSATELNDAVCNSCRALGAPPSGVFQPRLVDLIRGRGARIFVPR
jgi:hypothetical protein